MALTHKALKELAYENGELSTKDSGTTCEISFPECKEEADLDKKLKDPRVRKSRSNDKSLLYQQSILKFDQSKARTNYLIANLVSSDDRIKTCLPKSEALLRCDV